MIGSLKLNAEPLSRASPSRLEALRTCGYRVVLSRSIAAGPRGTPWTRLGTACHAVYEDAARGLLGDGTGAAFDQAFDKAWGVAIAAEADAAKRDPIEASWGPPKRWPGYALKKARLRRRARELACEASQWRPEDLRVEEELSPPGEVLFGKPDLVVRHPEPYRVIDYKTGAVTDTAGDLHAAYRRQLLLYAHLERCMPDGGLPQLAVVVPLDAPRIELRVDWDEVDREVADAHQLIDDYNAGLTDPASLATPHEGACGRCAYVARCDAFWNHLPEGVQAAQGSVTGVHHTDTGTVSITIDVTHGTVPDGTLHLHRFMAARNPALADAAVGQTLRVVGFKALESEPCTAQPAGWTRTHVLDT